MRYLFLLLISLLFLSSCSHESINSQVSSAPPTTLSAPQLQGYYFKNVDYYGATIFDFINNNNGNVLVDYNNSKIVRRVGGILSASSGSGVSGYFSKIVYDTIVYNGNTIESYNKIAPNSNFTSVSPNRKVINLNSNNQIVSKIYYKDDFKYCL
jgi:hypothetical protein